MFEKYFIGLNFNFMLRTQTEKCMIIFIIREQKIGSVYYFVEKLIIKDEVGNTNIFRTKYKAERWSMFF